MNPDAVPFVPSFGSPIPPLTAKNRRVYSRSALRRMEPAAVRAIFRAPLVPAPAPLSALRVPADFARLLRLPHADEFLRSAAHIRAKPPESKSKSKLSESNSNLKLSESNSNSKLSEINSNPKLLETNSNPKLSETNSNPKLSVTNSNPKLSETNSNPKPPVASPPCRACREGPGGCAEIAAVVAGALRRVAQSGRRAVLLQSGAVVWGALQLALVFEARQSSMRWRALAARHPRIVDRVREFLCGEGYHLPLPKVTAHEEWQELNQLLKFHWIRDNRTRVFTEISKRWKKRHTQFEQFVHFFGYRDDRPAHPVKNMITHSVKPVLIAVLSGDVVATVLLARLGFFVPPDYYWDIFPFFAESLRTRGESSMSLYNLMRHLCLHFFERMQTLRGDVFNPIDPPQKKPGAVH